MKFLHNYNLILESVTYAKAVLRKKDLDVDNPDYLKICDITNKDGFTGILTKLHFMYDVDLNEISDLYSTLKAKKVDTSKLLKMTYDDILQLVYEDDIEDDKDIILAFKYDNYNVYRVKSYDAGLSINSPSWCLKTKSQYDIYVKIKRGYNFVAIKKDSYRKGVLLLPTPNTFYGDIYTNVKNPMIRIGLTIYRNKSYDYFNDSNKSDLNKKKEEPLLTIYHKCCEWLEKNEKDFLNISYVEGFEGFEYIIYDILQDYTPTTFDFGGFKIEQTDINKILSTKVGEYTIKELFIKYKNQVLESELSRRNGILDILLYECYGKDMIELSGHLLIEREIVDQFIRYSYGIHKYLWGRKYILQSYKSVKDYIKFIVNNLHTFFFEDDYGMCLINCDISEHFLKNNLSIEDFNRMYDIKETPYGFKVNLNLVINNIDIREYSNKIVSYFEKILGHENVDLNGSKLSLFFMENPEDINIHHK